MNKLYLDFETKSRADLMKVGAWRYASDPSTDVICVGYAHDNGPIDLLSRAQLQAFDGRYFFKPDARIVAHNVQFEYAIYHFILHKRYGWPELLDPSRWDCTMARAYTCGLPGSLDGACLALKVPFNKDLEGKSALLKICKPGAKGEFNEDPVLYERVYKYNANDVECERALDKALPELTPEERRLFELDLRINRRGMFIDLGAAAKAAKIADGLTDQLNEDLRKLTGGFVSKASQLGELKRWVAAQGVKIPTRILIDKETNEEEIKETLDIEAVKDLCKDPSTPRHVLDVIRIRQQVGKSSVSKFKAMLACACGDGRVRGSFQYYGAHTGRWAGRLIQPTNYPQGFQDPGDQSAAIEMLDEGAGFFRAVYAEKAMQVLSDMLRGCIVAAPGKVFVNADLNAIECRVLNWLAGEAWVTALFARGESPYIRMAEGIYGKRGLTKKGNPKEYDIGKRSELGCGFGMGWLRFQANVYTETAKKGEGVYLEDELAQKAVGVYRESHPNVVRFWYATEAAAVKAVQNPGTVFPTADGRVLWGMSRDRQYLVCRLPSGRVLRYFRPSVVQGKNKKGEPKPELRYWAAARKGAIRTDCNGLLGEYRTWGGKLVENVVQATARDFMVVGMQRAEDAGMPVVLHNYDELNVEISAVRGSEDNHLNNLMRMMTEDLPAWTKGCPVKAEGWVGRRYRK